MRAGGSLPGTLLYLPSPAARFYVPTGARDPFGVETVATRDAFDLLTERVEVTQAAWNVVIAVNDYRVLAPVLVTDANGNRSAAEHDELAMVVKTAAMGKEGDTDGDTLADPTMRLEYELFNWANNGKPNFVHAFAREKHGASNVQWQESYAYSNGSGGVAMVKSQASPGKALSVNPDGSVVEVDADPRWVGAGRTVLNNKGRPVSATSRTSAPRTSTRASRLCARSARHRSFTTTRWAATSAPRSPTAPLPASSSTLGSNAPSTSTTRSRRERLVEGSS